MRSLAITALVLCTASAAQAYSSSYIPYMNVGDSIVSANTMNYLSKHLYGTGAAAGDKAPPAKRTATAATVLPNMAPGGTPRKLAESYPPAARAEVERTFTRLLSGYKEMEKQLDVPANDVAGAVAAFIAGSYMAYRDVDFADADFKTLVGQMRQVISSNPEFQRASLPQKQEMYEQMAIIGTSMALTRDALKQQPNPQLASNLRQAAKAYLEQFLKTDADKVQIDAKGLSIR
jgi:hypothetical protein